MPAYALQSALQLWAIFTGYFLYFSVYLYISNAGTEYRI